MAPSLQLLLGKWRQRGRAAAVPDVSHDSLVRVPRRSSEAFGEVLAFLTLLQPLVSTLPAGIFGDFWVSVSCAMLGLTAGLCSLRLSAVMLEMFIHFQREGGLDRATARVAGLEACVRD